MPPSEQKNLKNGVINSKSVLTKKLEQTNNIKFKKQETTESSKSKETISSEPNNKVVIPLTKANVKNMNNLNLKSSPTENNVKRDPTETSSTNSTPATTRPRRSVTLKKAEASTEGSK